MKNANFGAYIKARREQKGIPQRIVAHALNVDTSTLSKMELGERQITISMIKPLSESLDVNFKDLQIKYIAEKIMKDFSGQPFLNEALKKILNEEV
ncbi:helix-turn-helix domain-containing protein [Maribellus maritimus]|uniref:helix-turn-helix domain-containing protein n=1 Tax=Maribellus maritimus TaxID=2870838 RepID=UPI001EEBE3D7|nr:helix-turn-helix transcriptional regulator [Maribellus maritimus]MCG6188948.1 helix-turn-helix transcriptional regulator [Maribellus maritimus]